MTSCAISPRPPTSRSTHGNSAAGERDGSHATVIYRPYENERGCKKQPHLLLGHTSRPLCGTLAKPWARRRKREKAHVLHPTNLDLVRYCILRHPFWIIRRSKSRNLQSQP